MPNEPDTPRERAQDLMDALFEAVERAKADRRKAHDDAGAGESHDD